MTYDQAITRLEEITTQLSNGQTSVDQLVDQLTEAKGLIAFCQKQLTEVESQVKALTSDDTDTSTPNTTGDLWEKVN